MVPLDDYPSLALFSRVVLHRSFSAAPPRTRAFVDFLVARFRQPEWARWSRA